MTLRRPLSLLVAACLAAPAAAQGPDLDELQEQAVKSAAKKVAPCVVQIDTAGGTDIIPTKPAGPGGGGGPILRKGTGSTTGLVVDADGFIITSAFNFANKPQKIFVAVPGHKEKYPAEVHATDHSRMLTLLKIDAKGLPVPAAAPKKDLVIGRTVVALGRTLDPNTEHPPSVSVGIVSALNRIWGRAVQTDAKVSPANYGGPLVDLYGRVAGVLVPASPLSEDETAGVEWYDSGIGFAVPLEDVNAVLPKLKDKKDLRRGLLGITPKSQDFYGQPPVVNAVQPDSAAARAGIKPNDTILEIDGKAVVNQAQVMHQLGPKYDGDVIKVKVKHADGKEETFENVRLSASFSSVASAWLGVLPMRDDPELGVEVRYVYEKGPAEAAGLKAGDRIVRFGTGANLQQFSGAVSGRDQLAAFLATQKPKAELKLEVKRKDGGKTETLTVTLGEGQPDAVPAKLPPESTLKKALAPRKTQGGGGAAPKKEDDKKEDKRPEDGFFKRANAAQDHEYYLYVPDGGRYDPNVSYTLLVWLHPAGKGNERDIKNVKSFWENYCDKYHFILLCPKAEADTGWTAGEAEFIKEAAQAVMREYTIDRRRVLLHGMGVGGEMAFYLAFQARDLVRGVVTTGAMLRNQPKPQVPNQPLAFYLVAGDKDPVAPGVKDTKNKLDDLKYPVLHREVKNMGHQYLNDELADAVMEEVVRWIDSIDRM